MGKKKKIYPQTGSGFRFAEEYLPPDSFVGLAVLHRLLLKADLVVVKTPKKQKKRRK